jgi:guanylate cyclase soluble subunit beta
MYGLIHSSLRTMLRNDLGEQCWAQIAIRAAVSEDDFLSLKSYDDSVMLDLLAAASEIGQIELGDLLYKFGRHFVEHTAYTHYTSIMNMHGTTLWELLNNLNHMHDRMTSSFPDYRPPTFTVLTQEDGQYLVTYLSERQGLTRFVEGLLSGLISQFNLVCKVSVIDEAVFESGQQTRFLLNPDAKHV